MGRTSWCGRLSPKRRGVIAVTVLVLFLVGATVGSALSHHGGDGSGGGGGADDG